MMMSTMMINMDPVVDIVNHHMIVTMIIMTHDMT